MTSSHLAALLMGDMEMPIAFIYFGSGQTGSSAMQQFEALRLWEAIDKLAKRTRIKSAAIAYFTDNGIGLSKGDRLVTDASDNAIKCRQTDRDLLKKLVTKGVEIHSFPGLHAKVLIFDAVAIVGSMNSSQFSRQHLQEAAVMTDDLATVNNARQFIDHLINNSAVVNDAFVRRLDSLTLAKATPWRMSRIRKRLKLKRPTQNKWVVGLYDASTESLAGEDQAVFDVGLAAAERRLNKRDSSLNYFWLTGFYKLRKQARPGDLVIQIWRKNKKSKTPVAVFPPVPICHVEPGEKRTWFYVEEWADLEDRAVSWNQFKRIAKDAQLSTERRPIVPRSVRLLSERQFDEITSQWSR